MEDQYPKIGEVTVFQRSSSELEVAEVIEWAQEFIGTFGDLSSALELLLPSLSLHPGKGRMASPRQYRDGNVWLSAAIW